MKTLALFVCLLAVSTALPHNLLFPMAQRKHLLQKQQQDKIDWPSVKQFVIGFGTGAVMQLGNVQKCMPEMNDLFVHVAGMVSDLETAIKTKSISKTEAGLLELSAALKDLASALNDCGLKTAAADVMKVYKQCQAGLVWKIILSDAIHIFHNGKEFMGWIKGAINAWKIKDYFTAGKNVGEIVAFILKESANPTKDLPANFTYDAVMFTEGLAEGMAVTMGDPSLCIADVDGMVHQFDLSFQDLEYGFSKKSLRHVIDGIDELADGIKYGADTFKACGFITAAEDIEKIVVEIKSGKVVQVVIEEAVKIFSHGKQVEHLFIGAKDAWKVGDFKTSGDNVGQLVAFLISPSKQI